MMNFVERLLAVRPYRLTLQFSNGEVREADLEATLRARAASPQSAYARLLDPATFLRARLDPGSRTICWDGLALEVTAGGTEHPAPLDFCPDVLYGLSTPVAPIPSPASAGQGASALMLKDELPGHDRD
jgi:hypothetical protein